jgi:hypothetical protein
LTDSGSANPSADAEPLPLGNAARGWAKSRRRPSFFQRHNTGFCPPHFHPPMTNLGGHGGQNAGPARAHTPTARRHFAHPTFPVFTNGPRRLSRPVFFFVPSRLNFPDRCCIFLDTVQETLLHFLPEQSSVIAPVGSGPGVIAGDRPIGNCSTVPVFRRDRGEDASRT